MGGVLPRRRTCRSGSGRPGDRGADATTARVPASRGRHTRADSQAAEDRSARCPVAEHPTRCPATPAWWWRRRQGDRQAVESSSNVPESQRAQPDAAQGRADEPADEGSGSDATGSQPDRHAEPVAVPVADGEPLAVPVADGEPLAVAHVQCVTEPVAYAITDEHSVTFALALAEPFAV